MRKSDIKKFRIELANLLERYDVYISLTANELSGLSDARLSLIDRKTKLEIDSLSDDYCTDIFPKELKER